MRKKIILFLSIFLLFLIFLLTNTVKNRLIVSYKELESALILDRNRFEIAILPNKKGHFARYLDKTPKNLEQMVLKKEDRYFYYHFGINPISVLKEFIGKISLKTNRGSSTITQQVAKILLNHENKRSIKNKIEETLVALILEGYLSKKEILKMYLNLVYLGNRNQGFEQASLAYFGLPVELLNETQWLQLITAINNPNYLNPSLSSNIKTAENLKKLLNLDLTSQEFVEPGEVKKNLKKNLFQKPDYFELSSRIKPKPGPLITTIDLPLTEKIRKIVFENIGLLSKKNAGNAAVIVVKIPENEVLTLIGSVDPSSFAPGYQIDLTKIYRQVGSTIKPFIYLKGFEKNLRPYTLVDDKEYRYQTDFGFPFYPKNFDYQYRGRVDLHYSLANSLNVPTVKVLECVGVDNFLNFLIKDLGYRPADDVSSYQLGMALGILRMDLFHLTQSYTIFPNEGIMKSLKIKKNEKNPEKKVAEKKFIQLVNKILSDRASGVEQFGLKSLLSLPFKNYALKTGTSSDFRDSFVIGYTPDFLVAVWVGNADESPTEELSGQKGAGLIWSKTMEILLNSPYNHNRQFNFDQIKVYFDGEKNNYGLKGDSYNLYKNLLIANSEKLIQKPHNGDLFLLKEARINLLAEEEVRWFINEQYLGYGNSFVFEPKKAGEYLIKAITSTKSDQIKIKVIQD